MLLATNLFPISSLISENPVWTFGFPQECQHPIPLKVWLTGEKLQATWWHPALWTLCCANSTPGRVPLEHWWKLTFLFLSSNNMAFKMLLTLHNSSMVPFTWVWGCASKLWPQQQMCRAAEQKDGGKCQLQNKLWQVGSFLWSHGCKPPYFHIHLSFLADSWLALTQNSECDPNETAQFGQSAFSWLWNIFREWCYRQNYLNNRE